MKALNSWCWIYQITQTRFHIILHWSLNKHGFFLFRYTQERMYTCHTRTACWHVALFVKVQCRLNYNICKDCFLRCLAPLAEPDKYVSVLILNWRPFVKPSRRLRVHMFQILLSGWGYLHAVDPWICNF
jgi:hypothetical protein